MVTTDSAKRAHAMPGAGTDKTKRWIGQPAPVVVLVEPQMAENIGAVARAMANFGLAQLRLVKPLQGWPNEKARVMAAGADRVLDNAVLYDSLGAAIGDCNFVLAATARNHDQAKPVIGADTAAAEAAPRVAAGETVAIVFGRERNGLENYEVGMADRIVTLPVNPAFASLNLAQAVVIIGYEWFSAPAVRCPSPCRRNRRRRLGSNSRRSLPISNANWRRSNFPARGKARHHEREPAQYLPAHGAVAAGHAHLAWRDHGDRAGPQGSGARRRARSGRGRMLRNLIFEQGAARVLEDRAGARPVAAAAAQSDRGRARALAGAGERSPFRRPRLQAAGADRAAHRRFRVVPACTL